MNRVIQNCTVPLFLLEIPKTVLAGKLSQYLPLGWRSFIVNFPFKHSNTSMQDIIISALKPVIIEALEKRRDAELEELREKRKKLEEANAAKKAKEKQELEEKAKNEASTKADAQTSVSSKPPEGTGETAATQSSLDRTIEWNTPTRSSLMEVNDIHLAFQNIHSL